MRFTRFIAAITMLITVALSAQPSAAQAARQGTIVAVVNDEAISAADLDARMRLIMISSGLPQTADMKERMQPQILNMLIEERLKIQEAARLDIVVSPEDINTGLAQIASQNDMTADQFRAVLRQENIPLFTIEEQIRAEVAWGGVIQTALRPQIVVTDSEIDTRIERLRADIGTTEYLLSEIFLPVDEPDDDASARQLAERLRGEVSQGRAPFPAVAGQFSQGASAATGGDIGWIQKGQLAEELDEALGRLDEGDLSRPVRSLSGYHLLLLRAKRVIAEDNIPSTEDIHNRIGMERLERLQRRYLLDLKAEGFIEQRV